MSSPTAIAINGVNYVLLEQVESGIATGAISFDRSKYTRTYLIDVSGNGDYAGAGNNIDDITNLIQGILGYVVAPQTPTTDANINRVMPLADPVCPWMFAFAITSIKGTNSQGMTQADSVATYAVAPVPNYANFPQLLVTIEFQNRPYVVAPDSFITANYNPSFNWYDQSGTLNTDIPFCPEYQRFTEIVWQSKEDSVTATVGSMAFYSTNVVVNGNTYGAMPRKFLNNGLVTLRWHQVPWRFISSPNSWITSAEARGTVNQIPFFEIPGGYLFQPGELLYLNYVPKRYSQPVPIIDPSDAIFNLTDMLCDIDFQFAYTRRLSQGDVPCRLPGDGMAGSCGSSGSGTVNPNIIGAGWNLLPWFADRNFHYAQTRAYSSGGGGSMGITIPGGTPSFWSFPTQLLFADPDSV